MSPSNKHVSTVVIEQVRMKKSISLLHCVSILCSVTGHVSVFVAPTAILRYTGSIGLSLAMWLIGGVINLCLALCYTELATIFPQAGGPYAYVKQVFGDLPGFMIFWGYILLISAPFWALNAYTGAIYMLKPFYPECDPPDLAAKLLAAWFILLFVAVNCVYMKFVTKIQSILTLSKLLALFLVIVCGAIHLLTDGSDNLDDIWEGTEEDPSVVAVSFFFSIFTYGGWQILNVLMEEVKEPGRDVPRAVYMSFFIITLEFTLVNLAYFIVLSRQEILQSEVTAVLFFHKFYPPFEMVISILVSVTAIGVLNCSILGHSRMLFAAARCGHAPVVMSMIHTRYLMPWPALATLTVMSQVVLFSGGLFDMIRYISLCSSLMSLTVVLALLYLRWTQPHIHRPYKTFLLVPLSQMVLLFAFVGTSIYQDPKRLGSALAILAVGIPVYLLGVKWMSRPASFKQMSEMFTVSVQKLLSVTRSE